MPPRLVALTEGCDIPLDRAMIVVGRHPQCDARLDSIRISRRHCCMTLDHGDVIVRDLGSTNGIRINGQRVEYGRLQAGDELSIAHLRYRLDGRPDGHHQVTLADVRPRATNSDSGHHALSHEAIPIAIGGRSSSSGAIPVVVPIPPTSAPHSPPPGIDNPLAAAVRELLPASLAERCRIQVIVQMEPEAGGPPDLSPGGIESCPSNSSR